LTLRVKELEKEKEGKEQILVSSGFRQTKYMSYFVSEIVRLVPEGIQFSSIVVRPFSNSVKKNKKLLFDNEVILVKGNTLSNIEFSNWVLKLKKLDWVFQVEILDYVKDSFEIKIMIDKK